MTAQTTAAGNPISADAGLIEVRLRELDQFFNSMDPSPFHEKDLDPDARSTSSAAPESCRPRRPPCSWSTSSSRRGCRTRDESCRTPCGLHFARRAESSRRELRQLLRQGWKSLAIGLVFLAASVAGGEAILRSRGQGPLATALRESLLIGGWVAMWRPMEILLHEWWVVRDRHGRTSGSPAWPSASCVRRSNRRQKRVGAARRGPHPRAS